jgi:hypothetical protein
VRWHCLAIVVRRVSVVPSDDASSEDAYDAQWALLLPSHKGALLAYYRQVQAQQNELSWFARIPGEVLVQIAACFSRDPESFHTLKSLTKRSYAALGDYMAIADRQYMAPFVTRLINHVARHFPNSKRMRIALARVFDEKCRYIRLRHPDTHSVCGIDKLTGIILDNTAGNPRGYIWDDALSASSAILLQVMYTSRTKWI